MVQSLDRRGVRRSGTAVGGGRDRKRGGEGKRGDFGGGRNNKKKKRMGQRAGRELVDHYLRLEYAMYIDVLVVAFMTIVLELCMVLFGGSMACDMYVYIVLSTDM